MSSPQKTTKVKMPADEKLHPAHVVAIRPEVDGMSCKRGDYVLSVQTPIGTRNVVMPVHGTANVKVDLMQEVAPQTVLFSVTQTLKTPINSSNGSAHVSADKATSRSEPKQKTTDFVSATDSAGWNIAKIAFCIFALAFAAFLPGVLFILFGSTFPNSLSSIGIAVGVGFLLLTCVWFLSRSRLFSTRAVSKAIAPVSLIVFGGLLALGTLFPQFREFQKSIGEPFGSLIRGQLNAIGYSPLAPKQVIISLPNENTSASNLFEPQIGEVILVGFDFCPRGWVSADGQLMPIARYSALFSLFGTSYGGDGRTTFALPDLRGRAPTHIQDRDNSFGVGLGQKTGPQAIAVTPGSEKFAVGTPDLAMNYCIALEGKFPARS
ncbi:MAG: phage tail protein [Hyphomicrobiales bacterium]